MFIRSVFGDVWVEEHANYSFVFLRSFYEGPIYKITPGYSEVITPGVIGVIEQRMFKSQLSRGNYLGFGGGRRNPYVRRPGTVGLVQTGFLRGFLKSS